MLGVVVDDVNDNNGSDVGGDDTAEKLGVVDCLAAGSSLGGLGRSSFNGSGRSLTSGSKALSSLGRFSSFGIFSA